MHIPEVFNPYTLNGVKSAMKLYRISTTSCLFLPCRYISGSWGLENVIYMYCAAESAASPPPLIVVFP